MEWDSQSAFLLCGRQVSSSQSLQRFRTAALARSVMALSLAWLAGACTTNIHFANASFNRA
jgi:hypothetical protein